MKECRLCHESVEGRLSDHVQSEHPEKYNELFERIGKENGYYAYRNALFALLGTIVLVIGTLSVLGHLGLI